MFSQVVLRRFRKNIKEKIREIYEEEGSMQAIYAERIELIELIEELDINKPLSLLKIVEQEINQFKIYQDD